MTLFYLVKHKEMKVKELIEELKKYDENMKVVVYDWEDNTHDDSFTFKKEIESFYIWSDWKPIWSRIDKNKEMAMINTLKRKNKIVQRDVLVIYADY